MYALLLVSTVAAGAVEKKGRRRKRGTGITQTVWEPSGALECKIAAPQQCRDTAVARARSA
jgi:hypothetical protein